MFVIKTFWTTEVEHFDKKIFWVVCAIDECQFAITGKVMREVLIFIYWHAI